MGKVTDHGWSTSSDEIPQPISILLGRNLRKNFDEASKEKTQRIRSRRRKSNLRFGVDRGTVQHISRRCAAVL